MYTQGLRIVTGLVGGVSVIGSTSIYHCYIENRERDCGANYIWKLWPHDRASIRFLMHGYTLVVNEI